MAFAYDVSGTVARRSLRGSLTVKMTGTDAAGRHQPRLRHGADHLARRDGLSGV